MSGAIPPLDMAVPYVSWRGGDNVTFTFIFNTTDLQEND
jgi:hypothetical protein